MCNVQQISRSTSYDQAKEWEDNEDEITQLVVQECKDSRNINEQRKIDNAVAEAAFKSIKTEFVYGRMFACQQELDLELFDYVNCFHNIRIHGSLNDQSPIEYKRTNL